jgi:hypothetical protein
MRIAYLGLDEVNGSLVRRWAVGRGACAQAVAQPDAVGLGPDVAVVLDLDHLPEPWRREWVERIVAGRRVLAHGYNLTDEEATALRQAGVTVVRRRLTARHFARWCRRWARKRPEPAAPGAGAAGSAEVTPTGSEHGPDFKGKPQKVVEGGAKSGAVSADFSPIDPDLARIVATWPTLPESIRRAMLALVETAVPVAPETPRKAAGNRSRVEQPCFLGFFSTCGVKHHSFLPSDATSGA